MVAKETAKAVIDALPDEAGMDEIMHALDIKAKFERGEWDIRDGKGVAHEDAKKRMRRWLK